MRILIRNGYVLDPESKKEGQQDVLIEDEKIIKVGNDLADVADEVLDATVPFLYRNILNVFKNHKVYKKLINWLSCLLSSLDAACNKLI